MYTPTSKKLDRSHLLVVFFYKEGVFPLDTVFEKKFLDKSQHILKGFNIFFKQNCINSKTQKLPHLSKTILNQFLAARGLIYENEEI